MDPTTASSAAGNTIEEGSITILTLTENSSSYPRREDEEILGKKRSTEAYFSHETKVKEADRLKVINKRTNLFVRLSALNSRRSSLSRDLVQSRLRKNTEVLRVIKNAVLPNDRRKYAPNPENKGETLKFGVFQPRSRLFPATLTSTIKKEANLPRGLKTEDKFPFSPHALHLTTHDENKKYMKSTKSLKIHSDARKQYEMPSVAFYKTQVKQSTLLEKETDLKFGGKISALTKPRMKIRRKRKTKLRKKRPKERRVVKKSKKKIQHLIKSVVVNSSEPYSAIVDNYRMSKNAGFLTGGEEYIPKALLDQLGADESEEEPPPAKVQTFHETAEEATTLSPEWPPERHQTLLPKPEGKNSKVVVETTTTAEKSETEYELENVNDDSVITNIQTTTLPSLEISEEKEVGTPVVIKVPFKEATVPIRQTVSASKPQPNISLPSRASVTTHLTGGYSLNTSVHHGQYQSKYNVSLPKTIVKTTTITQDEREEEYILCWVESTVVKVHKPSTDKEISKKYRVILEGPYKEIVDDTQSQSISSVAHEVAPYSEEEEESDILKNLHKNVVYKTLRNDKDVTEIEKITKYCGTGNIIETHINDFISKGRKQKRRRIHLQLHTAEKESSLAPKIESVNQKLKSHYITRTVTGQIASKVSQVATHVSETASISKNSGHSSGIITGGKLDYVPNPITGSIVNTYSHQSASKTSFTKTVEQMEAPLLSTVNSTMTLGDETERNSTLTASKQYTRPETQDITPLISGKSTSSQKHGHCALDTIQDALTEELLKLCSCHDDTEADFIRQRVKKVIMTYLPQLIENLSECGEVDGCGKTVQMKKTSPNTMTEPLSSSPVISTGGRNIMTTENVAKSHMKPITPLPKLYASSTESDTSTLKFSEKADKSTVGDKGDTIINGNQFSHSNGQVKKSDSFEYTVIKHERPVTWQSSAMPIETFTTEKAISHNTRTQSTTVDRDAELQSKGDSFDDAETSIYSEHQDTTTESRAKVSNFKYVPVTIDSTLGSSLSEGPYFDSTSYTVSTETKTFKDTREQSYNSDYEVEDITLPTFEKQMTGSITTDVLFSGKTSKTETTESVQPSDYEAQYTQSSTPEALTAIDDYIWEQSSTSTTETSSTETSSTDDGRSEVHPTSTTAEGTPRNSPSSDTGQSTKIYSVEIPSAEDLSTSSYWPTLHLHNDTVPSEDSSEIPNESPSSAATSNNLTTIRPVLTPSQNERPSTSPYSGTFSEQNWPTSHPYTSNLLEKPKPSHDELEIATASPFPPTKESRTREPPFTPITITTPALNPSQNEGFSPVLYSTKSDDPDNTSTEAHALSSTHPSSSYFTGHPRSSTESSETSRTTTAESRRTQTAFNSVTTTPAGVTLSTSEGLFTTPYSRVSEDEESSSYEEYPVSSEITGSTGSSQESSETPSTTTGISTTQTEPYYIMTSTPQPTPLQNEGPTTGSHLGPEEQQTTIHPQSLDLLENIGPSQESIETPTASPILPTTESKRTMPVLTSITTPPAELSFSEKEESSTAPSYLSMNNEQGSILLEEQVPSILPKSSSFHDQTNLPLESSDKAIATGSPKPGIGRTEPTLAPDFLNVSGASKESSEIPSLLQSSPVTEGSTTHSATTLETLTASTLVPESETSLDGHSSVWESSTSPSINTDFVTLLQTSTGGTGTPIFASQTPGALTDIPVTDYTTAHPDPKTASKYLLTTTSSFQTTTDEISCGSTTDGYTDHSTLETGSPELGISNKYEGSLELTLHSTTHSKDQETTEVDNSSRMDYSTYASTLENGFDRFTEFDESSATECNEPLENSEAPCSTSTTPGQEGTYLTNTEEISNTFKETKGPNAINTGYFSQGAFSVSEERSPGDHVQSDIIFIHTANVPKTSGDPQPATSELFVGNSRSPIITSTTKYAQIVSSEPLQSTESEELGKTQDIGMLREVTISNKATIKPPIVYHTTGNTLPSENEQQVAQLSNDDELIDVDDDIWEAPSTSTTQTSSTGGRRTEGYFTSTTAKVTSGVTLSQAEGQLTKLYSDGSDHHDSKSFSQLPTFDTPDDAGSLEESSEISSTSPSLPITQSRTTQASINSVTSPEIILYQNERPSTALHSTDSGDDGKYSEEHELSIHTPSPYSVDHPVSHQPSLEILSVSPQAQNEKTKITELMHYSITTRASKQPPSSEGLPPVEYTTVGEFIDHSLSNQESSERPNTSRRIPTTETTREKSTENFPTMLTSEQISSDIQGPTTPQYTVKTDNQKSTSKEREQAIHDHTLSLSDDIVPSQESSEIPEESPSSASTYNYLTTIRAELTPFRNEGPPTNPYSATNEGEEGTFSEQNWPTSHSSTSNLLEKPTPSQGSLEIARASPFPPTKESRTREPPFTSITITTPALNPSQNEGFSPVLYSTKSDDPDNTSTEAHAQSSTHPSSSYFTGHPQSSAESSETSRATTAESRRTQTAFNSVTTTPAGVTLSTSEGLFTTPYSRVCDDEERTSYEEYPVSFEITDYTESSQESSETSSTTTEISTTQTEPYYITTPTPQPTPLQYEGPTTGSHLGETDNQNSTSSENPGTTIHPQNLDLLETINSSQESTETPTVSSDLSITESKRTMSVLTSITTPPAELSFPRKEESSTAPSYLSMNNEQGSILLEEQVPSILPKSSSFHDQTNLPLESSDKAIATGSPKPGIGRTEPTLAPDFLNVSGASKESSEIPSLLQPSPVTEGSTTHSATTLETLTASTLIPKSETSLDGHSSVWESSTPLSVNSELGDVTQASSTGGRITLISTARTTGTPKRVTILPSEEKELGKSTEVFQSASIPVTESVANDSTMRTLDFSSETPLSSEEPTSSMRPLLVPMDVISNVMVKTEGITHGDSSTDSYIGSETTSTFEFDETGTTAEATTEMGRTEDTTADDALTTEVTTIEYIKVHHIILETNARHEYNLLYYMTRFDPEELRNILTSNSTDSQIESPSTAQSMKRNDSPQKQEVPRSDKLHYPRVEELQELHKPDSPLYEIENARRIVSAGESSTVESNSSEMTSKILVKEGQRPGCSSNEVQCSGQGDNNIQGLLPSNSEGENTEVVRIESDCHGNRDPACIHSNFQQKRDLSNHESQRQTLEISNESKCGEVDESKCTSTAPKVASSPSTEESESSQQNVVKGLQLTQQNIPPTNTNLKREYNTPWGARTYGSLQAKKNFRKTAGRDHTAHRANPYPLMHRPIYTRTQSSHANIDFPKITTAYSSNRASDIQPNVMIPHSVYYGGQLTGVPSYGSPALNQYQQFQQNFNPAFHNRYDSVAYPPWLPTALRRNQPFKPIFKRALQFKPAYQILGINRQRNGHKQRKLSRVPLSR